MHFKYAGMLNLVFVTFMYGLAVPLLFPITFLFFAVSYIIERVCLAYSYRLPPSFDDSLNKSALYIMKFAPLTMMLFGYWVMGNRQIFSNDVTSRTLKTDPVITNHKGYEVMVNQDLPLFIMSALLVIFLIASGFFKTILHYLGIISEEKEIEVDEQLGNYFNCLSNNVRKGWLIDELHMRKNHEMCTVSDEMIS